MKKKHNEIMDQIKTDAELEIEQIEKKNQADITKIIDLSMKSKADLTLTKNKNTDLENEIDTLDRDKMDKQQLLNAQRQKNIALKEESQRRAEEIKEKDQLIGEKEKHIYRLKKKTQELEKFKFVLDYKIKELKREIAPKEAEITKLKVLTKQMDDQLKNFNRMNAQMGIIVEDLKDNQDAMSLMIAKNRTKIRANEILKKDFKDDVYDTVQYIDHFLSLQQRVTNMFEKYVPSKDVKTVEIDNDIKKEYENQKTYLKNSVTSLQKKKNKDKEIHEQSNLKVMEENMKLITQINTL